MKVYSANDTLKAMFGEEIIDADYISEISNLCENSDIPYQEAHFLPHDLLINWNEVVSTEKFGDEDTEDFQLDYYRDILFEIENNNSLKEFEEHNVFLKILNLIDGKLKSQTFIPIELEGRERWWNCIVFKKGTDDYINHIENILFEKFGIKLKLKTQIDGI